MDLLLYLQLAKAVFKEVWQFRYAALLTGFLVGTGLLVIGLFWQEKYETSATIYADQSNIISPLLEGQAQTTRVDNQLQVVRDTMLSQKALEPIIEEGGFLKGGESSAERSILISNLRSAVEVRSLGQNYIGITYRDILPTRSYSVVERLVSSFIKESSENKKSESRQAFLFIDKQVGTYKEQLQVAEQNLKEFNASNVDGTEPQAQQSIESLRQNIEVVELDLEQANERVQSLSQQVAEEDRYLSEKARSDVYNERIVESVEKLDELRLFYTDSHPDVIAMQEHIAALKRASESDLPVVIDLADADIENPVYDELRSSLASARVERDSIQSRLSSLNQRLQEARARLERIVARNAEFTELTRDYDVTRGLYEDLLERKERARLSMTLDIEGQGVTYKIQEPPEYPLVPSGLRFFHFVVLGIVAGIVVPAGLAVVYVFLDPRVRFAHQIQHDFEVPLLADVPRLGSSLTARLNRSDAKVFMLWFVLLGAVYVGIVLSYVTLR